MSRFLAAFLTIALLGPVCVTASSSAPASLAAAEFRGCLDKIGFFALPVASAAQQLPSGWEARPHPQDAAGLTGVAWVILHSCAEVIDDRGQRAANVDTLWVTISAAPPPSVRLEGVQNYLWVSEVYTTSSLISSMLARWHVANAAMGQIGSTSGGLGNVLAHATLVRADNASLALTVGRLLPPNDWPGGRAVFAGSTGEHSGAILHSESPGGVISAAQAAQQAVAPGSQSIATEMTPAGTGTLIRWPVFAPSWTLSPR